MSAGPLLEVESLRKEFLVRGAGRLTAVKDVSFQLPERSTLALVGESGCGKTTTGRLVLRLLEPTGGTICFCGQDVSGLPSVRTRALRRDMQAVFQDSLGAFNPRLTIGQAIDEPMLVQRLPQSERRARLRQALNDCELEEDLARRYPHQLSGGQRQRASIARAIVLRPKLIVADEPVSALDASIQSQVLNLLLRLQEAYGVSYLFISHDLAVVAHLADFIGVMYLGSLVEFGPAALVLAQPAHPYTRALLAACPQPQVAAHPVSGLAGLPPSPIELLRGCPFASRCAHAFPRCRESAPPEVPLGGGHRASCWLNEPGSSEVRGEA